jgi:hypothetical protein
VAVKDYVAADMTRYVDETDDVAGHADVARTDDVPDDTEALTWC